MPKRRVVILGAGISGLVVAWYLSRSVAPVEITILEKSSRAGGWLHTDHTKGFHFEKGARTFHSARSPTLLHLISELGLQEELFWSLEKNHHRYVWTREELQRVPRHLFGIMGSSFGRSALFSLLNEWTKPPKVGDETVWEFALRRFGHDVAQSFFDPMVVGIFGGDLKDISIKACFPKLKAWEEEYGSVTRGWIKTGRLGKKEDPFIFSFRRGVEQLLQALLSQIPAKICYHCEVKQVNIREGVFYVMTGDKSWVADDVFCALPAKEAGGLLKELVVIPNLLGEVCYKVGKELCAIPSQGIGVVNVGYDSSVLPLKGFGYLVPTHIQEEILGVIFDSSIFPEHNRNGEETRLTVQLRHPERSEEDRVGVALKGLHRHLKISQSPREICFKPAFCAIPQYGAGHLEKMVHCKQLLKESLPRWHLVGNYLTGVSVEHCVVRAKQAVEESIIYS